MSQLKTFLLGFILVSAQAFALGFSPGELHSLLTRQFPIHPVESVTVGNGMGGKPMICLSADPAQKVQVLLFPRGANYAVGISTGEKSRTPPGMGIMKKTWFGIWLSEDSNQFIVAKMIKNGVFQAELDLNRPGLFQGKVELTCRKQ